jgi:hypothetical protein
MTSQQCETKLCSENRLSKWFNLRLFRLLRVVKSHSDQYKTDTEYDEEYFRHVCHVLTFITGVIVNLEYLDILHREHFVLGGGL